MSAARRVRGPVSGVRASAVEQWASGRQLYLDNLKVILIAGIIGVHAVMGYAGFMDLWTYTEVREVTLNPVVESLLAVLVSPLGFLMIPLLFLVAGLLTRPSLERKGPGRFTRDRLVRLGVPFALYVLFVQPAVIYALQHSVGVATGSYWYELLGKERQIDTGPLWFVGVLLIFSLAYAGWVAVRRRVPARPEPRRIATRHLLLIVAVAAPASFLIRLAYPYGSEAGFSDLNLWEWPVCIALFTVGIIGSRLGWVDTVPERLWRQCRTAAVLTLVAMTAFLAVIGALDVIDLAMGGWNWAAPVFAALEVTLGVFGSVWVLSLGQRHLERPLRRAGPAVCRSAYGAFMVQTPVLIALAVALRPVPLPAEAKAVLVAAGGILTSFALARFLITRVPGVSRIL